MIDTFSTQQRRVLAYAVDGNADGIICDGAIRSGKTLIMSTAFVIWAMEHFNNHLFAICGKTVESAERNVILPLTRMEGLPYQMIYRRSMRQLVVKCGKRENIFQVFGGKDESSQSLIQGATLAGVLLDEVALMPESFVSQATARCSVDGSKWWFNCNPEGPYHWFKRGWIDHAQEKNLLYLHFTMEDNPGLSAEIKARYQSTYEGVFYRRYILGEWCLAEGLIYSMFDKDIHTVKPLEAPERYYLSCDYGTQNPFALGLISARRGERGTVYRLEKEYYHDGRKNGQRTDAQYADDLTQFANGYDIKSVIVDPSAASFIAELRKRGFTVIKGRNEVLDGIRCVSTALTDRRLFIAPECENTIREFASYSWDKKAGERGEDKPLKQNDHAMDMLRYALFTDYKNSAIERPRFSGRGARI